MKSLVFLVLVLMVITLLVSGCGGGNAELKKEALDIVKGIPLPDAGYSAVTGQRMEWESPVVRTSYTPDTGELCFQIISVRVDRSLRGQFGCSGLNWDVYCLTFLNENRQYKFTLAELEEYHDRLIWEDSRQ